MEVVVQTERQHVAGGLLAVDAAVDGIGRMGGIVREYLGGTSRRSHQHQLLLQREHGLHDGGGQRRLARTGGAAQNHHCLRSRVGCEIGKQAKGLLLFLGRHVPEVLVNPEYQFVGNHGAKVRKSLEFSKLFRTFAGEMKRSDTWTNILLGVLVAVLAAICISSVVHEQRKVHQTEQMRNGRDN